MSPVVGKPALEAKRVPQGHAARALPATTANRSNRRYQPDLRRRTRTRAAAPSPQYSEQKHIDATQRRADWAAGTIVEVIQNIVSALDAAVLAMMFYMPAKHAEPKEAVQRLERVKGHFARALHLIDKAGERPPSQREVQRLRAQLGIANRTVIGNQ